MRLTVRLVFDQPPKDAPIRFGGGLYRHGNGSTYEITLDEWKRNPTGIPPVCIVERADPRVVFWADITDNLKAMAAACGLYEAIWEPEKLGAKQAGDLANILNDGLIALTRYPEPCLSLQPESRPGNYAGLITFVSRYCAACRRWHSAQINLEH